MTIRAIVTDIEGTTTPIAFVHEVLFPYARERLVAFCAEHKADPAVVAALVATRAEMGNAALSHNETVATLLQWMEEDRKAGPLKTLQGLIWQSGYEAGVLKGQVYDDAAYCLRKWHDAGFALYVYSSGSVAAQKLIFGFSDKGDLTPLFNGYFDTAIGAKIDVASYAHIAQAIGIVPSEVLFLTDMPNEVVAARGAGLTVARIDRALAKDEARNEDHVLIAGSFGPVDRLYLQA